MATRPNRLDTVFAALGDPTRRKIIETLKSRECTVAELSSLFRISLPAVSKHITVLQKAGLLNRKKDGRFIICSYNPEPLSSAIQWISKQHSFWSEGFDSLEKYLDRTAKKKPGLGTK